ncbi:SRPBCC family protein [Chitinophaga solisilvae]|uniref:SRPBCC domain-containing protein n=1 Tax=Chitinophaga solisilvae TaxID=1233460 RepID=A0A433WFC1_9BACT|nr:SRPBCC domain-containing protein [Chitinophaga solisilvae]NSL87355.1 SRPBCC domain-containing protein [Chitinophaga solisilvae]
MKNEAPQPLIVERTFRAPVKQVWEALTDAEKMKKWYFDVPDFKPETGNTFTFTGEDKGITYLHLCRVTEVIPEKKLSYTWKYDGYEGESLLTFELFPEGDHTRLRLTHAGLHTFPQHNPSFARNSFQGGWDFIINTSLKNYLEGGDDAGR